MSSEPSRDQSPLTHLDERGAARMVDVGGKPVSHRRAIATAFVNMEPETLAMITAGTAPKGDVLATARIAGITAAKRTSDLIPLCHPLTLTSVTVDVEPCRDRAPVPERVGIAITATVDADGRTGVEMEALTAASVAALTVYDMCKAAQRSMVITDVALTLKEGGKSGRWVRTGTLDHAG